MFPVVLTCVSRKSSFDVTAKLPQQEPGTTEVVEQARAEGRVEMAERLELALLEVDLLDLHPLRQAEHGHGGSRPLDVLVTSFEAHEPLDRRPGRQLGGVGALQRAELEHAGRVADPFEELVDAAILLVGQLATVGLAGDGEAALPRSDRCEGALDVGGLSAHARPRSARACAAAKRIGAVARQLSEAMTPARSIFSWGAFGTADGELALCDGEVGGGALAFGNAEAELADVAVGARERLRQESPMLIGRGWHQRLPSRTGLSRHIGESYRHPPRRQRERPGGSYGSGVPA